MTVFRKTLPALVAILLGIATASAAQDTQAARANVSTLRGIIIARGVPIAGVNIFDIETLEGTVTREDGKFAIVVSDTTRRTVHLIAKAVGFVPLDTTLSTPNRSAIDSVVISLMPLATLMPISVLAGRYTATATRTTTLTPAEVASTPGSNADISGAIKTLPGVQNADEGSGIFVRGGDFTETRMFVDGAPLFSAYQFEAPTGSVAGTINPFLTNAITFSSGGFGTEWGNALSGIVDLRTQGRPARSYVNVNASILGATVGGALALPHGFGLTATIGATNLSAMLDLNGNPRAYAPAPHGRTDSALASWHYSRTGIVKMFGLVQRNAFGVPVFDPAFTSTFTSDRTSDVLVASWTDSIGPWRPFFSASTSGYRRDELKGAYHQSSITRSVQTRFSTEFVFDERVQLIAGAEVERLSANFHGQLPANQYNPAAGAPTVASLLNTSAVRSALHASLDTRPSSTTELILGIRTTQTGFAPSRTFDPRVSFAWLLHGATTLTASWGVYHQVADPAFLDRLAGAERKLPELRAQMGIAGVQFGEGLQQLRFEAWAKSYTDLVGLTRSYVTAAALTGSAKGADIFARTTAPLGTTVRLTYSLSSSRRADPNTGQDARAPFDVTSSITAILQKEWTSGWSAGLAVKRATGRPFTDVASATFDATRNVYVPAYAAPFEERLPSFSRTDLTLSKQRPFGANRFGVAFVGLNNVFNQRNTYGYTWSRDYASRLPVRSTVSRTFFIGANLVMLAPR